MAAGALIAIALTITVLAFIKNNGILYAMGIPLWLLVSFILYNLVWSTSNTFFAYGSILVAILMVLVMIVFTLNSYLSGRKNMPTDEDEQIAYRRQIYRLTHKKKNYWD